MSDWIDTKEESKKRVDELFKTLFDSDIYEFTRHIGDAHSPFSLEQLTSFQIIRELERLSKRVGSLA